MEYRRLKHLHITHTITEVTAFLTANWDLVRRLPGTPTNQYYQYDEMIEYELEFILMLSKTQTDSLTSCGTITDQAAILTLFKEKA